MRRITLAAIGFAVFTSSASAMPVSGDRLGCSHLVTVGKDEHAAKAIYAGTNNVTRHDLRRLGFMERCQRNPQARRFVIAFNRTQAQQHDVRVYNAEHPILHAGASWYNDGGQTASGFHSYYGVANLSLSFGTKVTFYYNGRSVTAEVDDRGPYVGGRLWDLNQNVAGALGFSGVHSVGYRIG